MRSLHTAILALLALVAFPATAHAETADVPAVCVADATADAALPAVVLGSSEFQAALESGATFIGADEAMEVPSTCFAVSRCTTATATSSATSWSRWTTRSASSDRRSARTFVGPFPRGGGA